MLKIKNIGQRFILTTNSLKGTIIKYNRTAINPADGYQCMVIRKIRTVGCKTGISDGLARLCSERTRIGQTIYLVISQWKQTKVNVSRCLNRPDNTLCINYQPAIVY